MTTPPPDKQPAAETPEEIAVQTLNRWRGMNVKISRDLYESPAAVAQLCEMITEALRNERSRAFDQGYVCAVANIMNLYGEETVAREVLNANRPKDWSIIDELDMQSLQPIFDHEAAQAEIRQLQAIREGK